LTSGFSPGSGVGAAAGAVADLSSVFVVLVLLDTTRTTMAATMARVRTTMPIAKARRRQ
jgi:hypothetical protein